MKAPEIHDDFQHWREVNKGITAACQNAEDIWNAACRYFELIDENPIFKPEFIRAGADVGKIFYNKIPRPYSLASLCLHIGISRDYFYYMLNDGGDEYKKVAQIILDVIMTRTYEYGLVGVYNPIIAGKITGNDEQKKLPPSINISVISSNSPQLCQRLHRIPVPTEVQ